jgi:hypothetical protein
MKGMRSHKMALDLTKWLEITQNSLRSHKMAIPRKYPIRRRVKNVGWDVGHIEVGFFYNWAWSG